MTKKDYVAIAALLKLRLEEQHNMDASVGYWQAHKDGSIEAITNIARDMARLFRDDNERFQRAKFLEACGLKE